MPRNNRPLTNNTRIGIKLPSELHAKAMAKATEEGKTLSEVIRALLEAYIVENSKIL